jgi:glycosyltransferase involved in cell wall biosynthesis
MPGHSHNSAAGEISGRRIGLLTASASRLGGGVFEAVVAQADLLRRLGAVPVIHALDDAFGLEDEARFEDAEVRRSPIQGLRQIGYAPDLVAELLNARLDCLHLHGIWMYPSRAATLWAQRTGGPYVISPHGMLDPWITARGRWKKVLARTGYERASWRAATMFHALTAREASDIACETRRNGSLIIANAGPEPCPPVTAPRAPDLLFLSRIHPKKNLALLVSAWRELAAENRLPAAARLTIAGWGAPDDLAAFEASLAGAPPSLRFIGSCFGEDKARALASARFLILPSLSEGLPMTILEAWAAGTPTLQTTECNLPEGFAAGAALDCGLDLVALKTSIAQALTIPDQDWLIMAQAARQLAKDRFSRERIAGQWASAYASLIAAAPGELP